MLASLVTPECLEDQTAIVQNIFAIMVDMEMHLVSAPANFDQVVTSALYFEQASKGVILVECSEELAYLFTSRLMSIDVPDSIDADVADSMAELANMIGGNLKGLMPAETHISMPVLLGRHDLPTVIGTRRLLTELYFASEHGVCRITLYDAD